MIVDIEALHKKLEDDGEESVRKKLSQGVYGAKSEQVRDWLSIKQSARSDESQTEQLKLTKSARNAAWVSALAAVVAVLFSAASVFK